MLSINFYGVSKLSFCFAFSRYIANIALSYAMAINWINISNKLYLNTFAILCLKIEIVIAYITLFI